MVMKFYESINSNAGGKKHYIFPPMIPISWSIPPTNFLKNWDGTI